MNVRILKNHDPAFELGELERLEGDGRGMLATFKPRSMTLPGLMGLNGGWRVIEWEELDGVRYVVRAELLCLSTEPDPPGVHAGQILERCWREFLAGHPEVRAMTGDHVDKIKSVWLDGAQSAQQVMVDGNPGGPTSLERLRACARELADAIMADITRIHGREN